MQLSVPRLMFLFMIWFLVLQLTDNLYWYILFILFIFALFPTLYCNCCTTVSLGINSYLISFYVAVWWHYWANRDNKFHSSLVVLDSLFRRVDAAWTWWFLLWASVLRTDLSCMSPHHRSDFTCWEEIQSVQDRVHYETEEELCSFMAPSWRETEELFVS